MNRAFIRETGLWPWLWRTAQRQFFKRILRRTHSIRLPTGNRFLLPIDSFSATEVFVAGSNIDWGSEALLARLVDGKGAFLDVGANIGYYSVYFEPLVEQVFAFEPDPRARRHLFANVGSLPKVEVVTYAVGPETGTARFTQTRQSEVSHIAAAGELGVDVPMVSIDDFVTERDLTVSAIKTDVEGHDLDALRGAEQVLAKQRPLVLSELQPSSELAELTKRVGYAVFACAREPESRATRFVRADAAEARGLAFKMLLLVPNERVEEVRRAV